MIFQSEHREQIRTGEKTATRRDWERQNATPGKTYRATLGGNVEQGMFVTREECDCFIRATDVYEQPLSDMTDADAQREGDYAAVDEFRETWESINGAESWDPEKVVYVVEFEYAGDSDPEI